MEFLCHILIGLCISVSGPCWWRSFVSQQERFSEGVRDTVMGAWVLTDVIHR